MQEAGSQPKYYMGENQEPVEARLDAESSNTFPKDVKGYFCNPQNITTTSGRIPGLI